MVKRKKKGSRRRRTKWSVGSIVSIDAVLRFLKLGGVPENVIEIATGTDVSPGGDTLSKMINDPQAGFESAITRLKDGGFDYVALFKGPILYSVLKSLMKLSGNYTDVNKILKMGGGRL